MKNNIPEKKNSQNHDALNAFQKRIKQLNKELRPTFKKISDGIQIVINETPDNIFELSKYGWYLDFNVEFKTPVELGRLLKNGEINKVNDYLNNYYTEELDYIENRLVENYPQRKRFFSSAFSNHRKGDYISAIVVLLTQADGICYDKTEKKFFISDRKNEYLPQIEQNLRKFSHGIVDLFLSPISNKTTINVRAEELVNFPIRLNRHEIIHGVDIDFDSKTNSLKIISFINYLDNLFDKILQ